MLRLDIRDAQVDIDSIEKRSPPNNSAYFHQCSDLIRISRELIRMQRPERAYELRELIKAIDATIVKCSTHQNADADEAIRSCEGILISYNQRQQITSFNENDISRRMQAAREKDNNFVSCNQKKKLALFNEDEVSIYMKIYPRVGKAYFHQSIELITISRELAEAQGGEMINDQKNLNRTIETTLAFTVKAKSSKLARADEAIESCTTALKRYVIDHRIAILSMDDLTQRMQKAKEKDQNAMGRKGIIISKIRNLIKRHVLVLIYVDHDWDSPNIHYLGKLASDISLNVILFRLVERNLIQLRSNPHFYHIIPTSENYVASNTSRKGGSLLRFSDQLDEVDRTSNVVQLHVLMDRPIHISFEGIHIHRIFGNIWEYNKKTYLKDIRGYLLEAEELREEIQPYGGLEVEMVTPPGSRISYKWEDALKEALLARKNIAFRPVAAKTERVDSGYLSNPACPVSPALSSEPPELSIWSVPQVRMTSPSHVPPDQFNLTPKPHAMPMSIPDANLLNYLLNYPPGPSRLVPPSMCRSFSVPLEEDEAFDSCTHHFKNKEPIATEGMEPTQPVHEL